MEQIDAIEAQKALPELLQKLEAGLEASFVITRGGRPLARLVPFDPLDKAQPSERRIGVARGLEFVQDDWDLDSCNDEIAELFDSD